MNLEEVASRIGGLTRERARQIKNKALEKLAENKQAQEKLVRYFSYQ
jgi:DNA-directed RNA polymerase sigma subunit (sigma70/sigma32)